MKYETFNMLLFTYIFALCIPSFMKSIHVVRKIWGQISSISASFSLLEIGRDSSFATLAASASSCEECICVGLSMLRVDDAFSLQAYRLYSVTHRIHRWLHSCCCSASFWLCGEPFHISFSAANALPNMLCIFACSHSEIFVFVVLKFDLHYFIEWSLLL